MGKTSQWAEGLLVTKTNGTPDMACQVLVVGSDDKPLANKYSTYGSGCLVHVEDMLFHLLQEEFGDLASIPPGSKVVFYGHWSPCRHCMSQTIPPRLQAMKIADRNIQIRFRFGRYYTKEAWTACDKQVRQESGGHYFWDSNEEAQKAYDELASLYGKFPLKNISTPQQVITTVRPRVAFIQGLARSRTITYWHESYRHTLS